jgi:hypothetical protein
MPVISQAEYEARLAVFKREWTRDAAPRGFFGNWALHANAENEFRKMLSDSGISIEVPPQGVR